MRKKDLNGFLSSKLFIKLTFISILGVVVSIVSPVNAFEVKDLYQIELKIPPTAKNPNASEKDLAHQAFKSLMIRLTGTNTTITNDSILAALNQADKYVEHSSYKNNEEGRILSFQFDESLIRQLLMTASIPMLDKDRPMTLFWWVVEDEAQTKQFFSEEKENGPLAKTILQTAQKFGIPYLFPLLDLNDTAISEKDIWDLNFVSIEPSLQSYHADLLWLGRISKTANGFVGRFTFKYKNAVLNREFSNKSLDGLIKASLEEYAALLNSQFGTKIQSSNKNGKIKLAVAGIKNIDQYSTIYGYLRALPTVNEVSVTEIMPDETVFALTTPAEEEVIAKAINTDSVIILARGGEGFRGRVNEGARPAEDRAEDADRAADRADDGNRDGDRRRRPIYYNPDGTEVIETDSGTQSGTQGTDSGSDDSDTNTYVMPNGSGQNSNTTSGTGTGTGSGSSGSGSTSTDTNTYTSTGTNSGSSSTGTGSNTGSTNTGTGSNTGNAGTSSTSGASGSGSSSTSTSTGTNTGNTSSSSSPAKTGTKN